MLAPGTAGAQDPSLVLGDGGLEFPDGSVQETAVATALTPIESVPFTIDQEGSYYLTDSFAISSGVAITIDAINVTLNLMGHTLDGSGSSVYGIEVTNTSDNVVIRNGSIVNFNINGVQAAGTGVKIIGIRASNQVTGLGIRLDGAGGTVAGCTARGNAGPGILVSTDAIVRDSLSTGNLGGIVASTVGAKLARNVVISNTNNGILCFDECTIVDNTVRDNNVADNATLAGIHIQGNNSLVRGNHVTGNKQQNILVSGHSNAIEGNTLTDSTIGLNFAAAAGDNAAADNRWGNHVTADFQNNGVGTIATLDNLAF